MSTRSQILDLVVRWQELRKQNQGVTPEQLCADCPELLEPFKHQIQELGSLPAFLDSKGQDKETLPSPACHVQIPKPDDSSSSDIVQRSARDALKFDFLAPPQSADEMGRLGNYRVLEVLGRGGMGVVFKAEDPHLERLVALKAMLPALAKKPQAKQRFFREAKAAAALKHPNIVTIHQVGEDRGVPYLAMEFLEGEALDDRLKRETKLPIPEVLRIGQQVAVGLAAAHAKGLIHRDIKAANIWLESMGEGNLSSDDLALVPRHLTLAPLVKILDFGLARVFTDELHLTQSGVILGTPAYMPPEQARGDKVDHRCDLYSLGCVLYRMATGELPFKGKDTMALLMALALNEATPPKQLNNAVPQSLNDLILGLLAKDAAQRPESAQAVVLALRKIEQGTARASQRSDVSRELAVLSQPSVVALPPSTAPAALSAVANLRGTVVPSHCATSRTARAETDAGDTQASPGQLPQPETSSRRRKHTLPTRAAMAAMAAGLLAVVAAGVTVAIVLVNRMDDGSNVRIVGELAEGSGDPKFPPPTHVKATEKQLQAAKEAFEKAGARLDIGKDPITQRTVYDFVMPPQTGDDDLRSLPDISFSFGLDLRETKVTDAGLAYIVKFKNLRMLSLGDCEVTFEGVRDITNLKNLTTLYLFRSLVADAGLKQITRLQNLTELSLDGTKISDSGLKNIANLRKLKTLSLINCEVTFAGVKATANLANLTDLYLQSSLATDEGLKEIANLKNLQVLNLGHTKVTFAGVKEIANLTNLKQLELYNAKVTDAGLEEIGTITSLTHLMLDGNGVTDAGVKGIAKLPVLLQLSLNDTKVTDASIKEFRTLKKLTNLGLSNTLVTDLGLKEIATLKHLIMLKLGGAQVTDAGLKELAKLDGLVFLGLNGNVTDAGVNDLRKAIPKCQIVAEPSK